MVRLGLVAAGEVFSLRRVGTAILIVVLCQTPSVCQAQGAPIDGRMRTAMAKPQTASLGWDFQCSNVQSSKLRDSCVVSQAKVSADDAEHFFVINFRGVNAHDRTIEVITPLGKRIGDGVGVNVDHRQVTLLRIFTCNNQACLFVGRVDERLRGEFENGKSAEFAIRENDNSGYALEFQLHGLKEALSRMDEEFARRLKRAALEVAQLMGLSHSEIMRPEFTDTNSIHKVKSGETLVSIAKQHNTTVAELLRVNSTLEPSKLESGVEIVIPAGGSPPGIVETLSFVNHFLGSQLGYEAISRLLDRADQLERNKRLLVVMGEIKRSTEQLKLSQSTLMQIESRHKAAIDELVVQAARHREIIVKCQFLTNAVGADKLSMTSHEAEIKDAISNCRSMRVNFTRELGRKYNRMIYDYKSISKGSAGGREGEAERLGLLKLEKELLQRLN